MNGARCQDPFYENYNLIVKYTWKYFQLSAILGSARRELLQSSGRAWTTDSLLSPDRPLVRAALGGLTCADVLAMDLVDFPVIMAAFNQRREAAGMVSCTTGSCLFCCQRDLCFGSGSPKYFR